MTEEDRKNICNKIDEAHKKNLNIFQRIGWKLLQLMWDSLFNNRNC